MPVQQKDCLFCEAIAATRSGRSKAYLLKEEWFLPSVVAEISRLQILLSGNEKIFVLLA